MEIITKQQARARGLDRYFTGKPCKHGHVSPRYTANRLCTSCASDRSRSNYWRDPAAASQERSSRRRKNIDQALQRDRAYRENNKAKISSSHVALRRAKRANDPIFAMKHRVRSLISNSLARGGFGKSTKSAEILGCTWLEFKTHMERQFLKGMTWENRHLWHIDHITPLATAQTEADVIALNHFTNLRPLWGPDNLAKRDQVQFLI